MANSYTLNIACEGIYIFLIALLVFLNGKRRCSDISFGTIIVMLGAKLFLLIGGKLLFCTLIFWRVIKIVYAKIYDFTARCIMLALFLWVVIDFFTHQF